MWRFLQYESWQSQKVKKSHKKFKKKVTKSLKKSQLKPDFWSLLKPAALWPLLAVTIGYNYDGHNVVLEDAYNKHSPKINKILQSTHKFIIVIST
jgi:hypothetical protein